MSAYLCSACHLSVLAEAAVRQGIYRGDTLNWQREVFDLLARANHSSVRVLYPHQPDPGMPTERCWTACELKLSPVEMIKACQAYQHQACEPDDWEQSIARKLTDDLIQRAIEQLTGYEAAPWGVACPQHGAEV